MVKQKQVFDLITGEYNGAWLNDYKTSKSGSGRKPKIRHTAKSKIKSLLPFFESEEYFPYNIDPRKNVVNFERRDGEIIKLLVPTKDIKGVDFDQTVLAKLMAHRDDELEKTKEELRSVKKDRKRLKKKVKKLQKEEDEKDKDQSGKTVNKVPCPNCGEKYAPQKWTSTNRGRCPNCNQRNPRYR